MQLHRIRSARYRRPGLASLGVHSAPFSSRETSRPLIPTHATLPSDRDYNDALTWFEDYRPAGLEGLVIKAGAGRYSPGARDWVKVKNRQSREVIIGAVIGPIDKPDSIIAGLTLAGTLIIAGRSSVLTAAQRRNLAEALTPARVDHPWPATIGGGFGRTRPVAITRVDPVLVAEISADTALQAGRFRHPVRYLRLRLDMHPDDVDPLNAP